MDLRTYDRFFGEQIIPYKKINRDDNTPAACSICLDPPSDPMHTFCHHVYCYECLRKWCQDRNTCPNCRTPLFTRATIPTKRLVQIPAGFFERLDVEIFDRDGIQQELYMFDGFARAHGEETYPRFTYPPNACPRFFDARVGYTYFQSMLVAAGIWYSNKVDLNYQMPPARRDMFKSDWIKVVYFLNEFFSCRDAWSGNAEELLNDLTGMVLHGQTEEPRRHPDLVEGWSSVQERDEWFRTQALFWRSDGWHAHVEEIKTLINYLVLRGILHARASQCTCGEDHDDEEEEEEEDMSEEEVHEGNLATIPG